MDASLHHETLAGPSLPASEASSGLWEWSCRLVPRAGRRWTLHLSGSLHHGWAGQVAAGLAARNVNVLRARARRGPTAWTAEIDVDLLEGADELSAIDFIDLMREHPAPVSAEAIRLDRVRVTPRRGDVEVAIRGADAVGFLGRILLMFAELGLYPRAMQVETVGSAVRDLFLLQDGAGDAPSDAVVAALRGRLAACLPLASSAAPSAPAP